MFRLSRIEAATSMPHTGLIVTTGRVITSLTVVPTAL
jgi:hypothetical protein